MITMFIKFIMLLTIIISSTAMAVDNPHCVTKKEYPIIITQCDDGTVTIANVVKGTASVCRKGELCKEIKL